MNRLLDPDSIRYSLQQPVSLDPYLTNLSQKFPSHRFLGKAQQGCYLRLISLLDAYTKNSNRSQSDLNVLDWGAGKGHISYLLALRGYNVSTCDFFGGGDSSFCQDTPIINEQKIKVTKLNHDWHLPYKNSSFDIVVSFGVLEHVLNDLESLKEIRRVLKEDGIFLFALLPYWLSWTQRLAHLCGNKYHDRLYKKRDVYRLAKASGFHLDSIWHGQLFPKNSMPHNNLIERLDRFLTFNSPLKYLATNLEGIMR
jgi:SAM-dependent methyltransferase